MANDYVGEQSSNYLLRKTTLKAIFALLHRCSSASDKAINIGFACFCKRLSVNGLFFFFFFFLFEDYFVLERKGTS